MTMIVTQANQLPAITTGYHDHQEIIAQCWCVTHDFKEQLTDQLSPHFIMIVKTTNLSIHQSSIMMKKSSHHKSSLSVTLGHNHQTLLPHTPTHHSDKNRVNILSMASTAGAYFPGSQGYCEVIRAELTSTCHHGECVESLWPVMASYCPLWALLHINW